MYKFTYMAPKCGFVIIIATIAILTWARQPPVKYRNKHGKNCEPPNSKTQLRKWRLEDAKCRRKWRRENKNIQMRSKKSKIDID